MILILTSKGYIHAYNKIRPKESVDSAKNEVWYDGDFDFNMGENIEGKVKKFRYDNGEINIEYVDIPETAASEPTQLDRIEAAIAYSNMMAGGE